MASRRSTATRLVPVGKAYFGFTDEELRLLDRYVRNHTSNRFGPVREVVHGKDEGLVLEIAFEGVNRSSRHKSGVAMRFPRINRIRWDKPAREADRLETLEDLIVDVNRCASRRHARRCHMTFQQITIDRSSLFGNAKIASAGTMRHAASCHVQSFQGALSRPSIKCYAIQCFKGKASIDGSEWGPLAGDRPRCFGDGSSCIKLRVV